MTTATTTTVVVAAAAAKEKIKECINKLYLHLQNNVKKNKNK